MKLFQYATEWVLRLIWTNLLWIGYTLLGLVVFGVMPATVALFTVTRRWTKKEYDFSIWETFKETYFSEWKDSNKIGLIFWIIAFVLFVDFRFAFHIQGFFSLFLIFLFIFVSLLFIMTLIFFFPIYVHYTYSIKDYIKQSFIHSVVSMKETIMILIGLFFIGFLIYTTPGFIPFLTGVLPAYWIMNVCMNKFRKLEKEHAKQE